MPQFVIPNDRTEQKKTLTSAIKKLRTKKTLIRKEMKKTAAAIYAADTHQKIRANVHYQHTTQITPRLNISIICNHPSADAKWPRSYRKVTSEQDLYNVDNKFILGPDTADVVSKYLPVAAILNKEAKKLYALYRTASKMREYTKQRVTPAFRRNWQEIMNEAASA